MSSLHFSRAHAFLFASSLGVSSLALGSGCASNSATAPGADAAAPLIDAGAPVNGCGESEFAANDHTAESDPRTIQAPPTAAPAQYVPNCIRIKAGQTVTFVGDNADHPVDFAEVSGGMPYPIVSGTMGTSFTLTIANPGVVKFNCDIHPMTMLGAIEIEP